MIRIENYKGKDCIIFPAITGEEYALYPHYKELPLVEEEQIKNYKAETMTEIEALYEKDCTALTNELVKAQSPAAMYAREIDFNLSSLGVLAGILLHRAEIDKLSKTIGGDRLPSFLWSCCRYNACIAWYANGGIGFFGGGYMFSSYGVAPVSLYQP